jgi:hypothetical protein
MERRNRWFVGLAVLATIGSLAVGLALWAIITHPVHVAQTLAGVR